MTFRSLVAAGAVAVVAAAPLAVAPAVPASAATAKAHYVAIVISGHGSHCVKWTSGITGDTVLNDVATVVYRPSDGLIVQIDGDPASGTADDTHYWSYWHDTSSSWAYSNYGASSYRPKAGTVEGWSYDNGKSSAPAPSQNPAGLYTKLCGAKDAASSATVPVRRTSEPAPRTSSATTSRRSGSTAAPSRSSTPSRSHRTARTSPATAAATSSTSSRARHETSTASTANATSTPSTTARASGGRLVLPASSPDSLSASPAADAKPSTGTPTGLIVGLGLVVLLGAGAGGVALRRRDRTG